MRPSWNPTTTISEPSAIRSTTASTVAPTPSSNSPTPHPHRRRRRPLSRPPEPPGLAPSWLGQLLRPPLDRRRIDAQALRKLLARHPLAGGGGPPVSMPWTLACGPDATPRRAPSAATTTIRRATPRVSPSWPGGPTSSSPGSASSARALERPRGRGARTSRPGLQRARRPEQVEALLWVGSKKERPRYPLFVFEAGYDPVKLQRGLQGSPPCQIPSCPLARRAPLLRRP